MGSRWGSPLGAAGLAAIICCIVALSGCVGATKLPAKTNGPTGTRLENNEIDFTFLQSGTTRRDEVISKLSRIDTGYSSPGMFWGRWSASKWGHWVILPGPGMVGGDASRNWHVHNLLVSFDENGVMQSKDLIDSERDLERELRSRLPKTPPLDLSKPIPIGLKSHYSAAGPPQSGLMEMTISQEGIVMGKYSTATISPRNVTRISYERFYGSPRSDSICHSLHMSEKTPVGKRVLICTSAADMGTLFKYLQQTGPSSMRWE